MNKKILILALSCLGTFLSAASAVTQEYNVIFKLNTGKTVFSSTKTFSSVHEIYSFMNNTQYRQLIDEHESQFVLHAVLHAKAVSLTDQTLSDGQIRSTVVDDEEAGRIADLPSIVFTLRSWGYNHTVLTNIKALMGCAPEEEPSASA